MKVSAEPIEGSQVVLNVEVDDDRLERSMERAYRRLVSKANIPGFRKGKAPRFMLERFLGRAALLEEALEILIPEAYNQAIEDQNIEAVAQPRIEVVQVEPVVFKATVPVKPTIELGDYHQLSFSLEPKQIAEEDLSNALEQLRSRYATWEPVDRPVAFDDRITADVENSLEGRPERTDSDVSYVVTEGLPVPLAGFPEQLVGIEKDGQKEFTLNFPEDHPEESLAGKEVKFKVTVKEIKEKKLPELDDEFAKSVGEEFENLEQLKEKLRSNLQEEAQREARRSLEEQVVDAIVGMAKVGYPEVLVEHEIDHLIQDESNVPRDPQGRIDNYLASIGKSEEEFREEWRPIATQRVLRSLVLRKVAEVEGVAVTEEDIEAEIDRLAGSSERSADFRALFSGGAGREQIERVLFGRKTMDRLVDIVTGQDSTEAPEAPFDSAQDRQESPPTEAESGEASASAEGPDESKESSA